MKSFFKAMNKNVEMDLSVWNSNFQGLMRPNKKIGPQIREIMNDSMCNEILSDGERVFEAVTTKFTWKFQGKKIMDWLAEELLSAYKVMGCKVFKGDFQDLLDFFQQI